MAFSLPTKFAPAERAPLAEIQRQAGRMHELALMRQALDAVPDLVVILNQYRQVVFANQAVLRLTQDDQVVWGQRPGELLGCVFANRQPGGCGTSEFCQTCGAVKAILSALQGDQTEGECRLTRRVNGHLQSLDFRVWASPMIVDGESFTVFSAANISDEKRRHALEKIFFHDVLNTAGALQGAAYLLQGSPANDDVDELKELLFVLSNRLVDEIQAQQELVAAENNELVVELETINSIALWESIIDLYQVHSISEGRQLVLDSRAESVDFSSDRSLLGRVLSNMVKNGLEAALPDQTVTLGCRQGAGKVEFWVHNPTVISRPVQLQLFQRSFSTKGAGRGLGTYSMRLLSEQYLQGSVSFVSTEQDGTTFSASYPLRLQLPEKEVT